MPDLKERVEKVHDHMECAAQLLHRRAAQAKAKKFDITASDYLALADELDHWRQQLRKAIGPPEGKPGPEGEEGEEA